MNIKQYLDHIQIDSVEPPTYSFLAKLQQKHLYRIPFENLDVVLKRPILLDIERLYEKVIGQNRGGFCYELNGLFGWLLQELGFSVTRISAQVYSTEQEMFGFDFDHMALLVHFEQAGAVQAGVDQTERYLVDVGFGDSFRRPILMPDGLVEDVGEAYRVHKIADGNDGTERYLLQKQHGDGWLPQYRFTTTPRQMADYAEMCLYQQTSPDSPFTQRQFCTVATAQGRVTLSKDSLTTTAWGKKTKVSVSSSREFERLLQAYFGITLRFSSARNA